MITADDRTPEQKLTHCWAVVARDRFMSGWGEDVNIDRVENWVASGGYSRCAWAVGPDLRTYRPKTGTKHFHIYVVNADHPAARY